MKKFRSMICTLLVLLLAVLPTGGRSWAARSAERHLTERYRGWMEPDKLAVSRVELLRGRVELDYDGMTVAVDLADHTDNFAEKYVERTYRDRILAAYPGNDIRLIGFPVVYPEGDLNASDHLFWLEVAFDGTVNSREKLASAAERMLTAIREAGLTNCDAVKAFAEIDGRVMRLLIPGRELLTAGELAALISEMPQSD